MISSYFCRRYIFAVTLDDGGNFFHSKSLDWEHQKDLHPPVNPDRPVSFESYVNWSVEKSFIFRSAGRTRGD